MPEARRTGETRARDEKEQSASWASTEAAETEVRQDRGHGLKGFESHSTKAQSHPGLTNRDNVQVHHCELLMALSGVP